MMEVTVLNDPFPDFRISELIRAAQNCRLSSLSYNYSLRRGTFYSLVLEVETGPGSSLIQYEIFFDDHNDSWYCKEVRRLG